MLWGVILFLNFLLIFSTSSSEKKEKKDGIKRAIFLGLSYFYYEHKIISLLLSLSFIHLIN